MVSIRNFTLRDIAVLQKQPTYDKPVEEVKTMIEKWNKKDYQGRYFEMFAITEDQEIKGTISLYQHTSSAVSIGLEIFLGYYRQGYGFQGEKLALEYAKKLGYKIAAGNVQVDNPASIALQKKLGFEIYREWITPNGQSMYFFIKSLG
jgi:RimJ/RimL family protein N-acetyltransferase